MSRAPEPQLRPRQFPRPGRGGIVDPSGELTGEEVAREFPDWEISKASSGLWYARLRESTPPVVTSGEDPTDLRDEIRRKLPQAADALWLAAHRPRPPPLHETR